MNIAQLERLLEHARELERIVEEDAAGSYDIARALESLLVVIQQELKERVWVRYLKEAKP